MVNLIESSCTSCGHSLRANAKFCPGCGTKIEISKPVVKKKKAPKIRAKKEQIEDDSKHPSEVQLEDDSKHPSEVQLEDDSKHPSEVQLEAFTTIDAINFNLIPDILIRHHDELVKTRILQSGNIGKSESSQYYQLQTLCSQLLQIIIGFRHANKTSNEYILDLIDRNKKIKQDNFDYLLETTKSFLRYYKNMNNVFDSLILKNIGNKEIHNKLKKRIDGGNFLSLEQYRYYVFCSLEIEKEKIFDSGKVPTGWLPSDTDPKYEAILMELEKSKNRQGTFNMLLAAGILANSILRK